MSTPEAEKDWWAESLERTRAADEAAEQSQLAFLTGNGPAYMQAKADEIKQRWDDEYKGPTDADQRPDDQSDAAAGVHGSRGAEPDPSGPPGS